MTEGPLGGAAFNNEFGRPNLLGYFREYEQDVGAASCARLPQAHHDRRRPGQHRRRARRTRSAFPAGTLLIQLGGPGMRIGMGGSAASSMATGANAAELDFDSVQRGNPEIERRAQEVINHCWQLGEANPDPGDPRRRRGRPVQRLPGADQRRRPRRALRPARGAAGGVGPGAQGDLVQREPGALRAGDRAGIAGAVPRVLRARALPVRGGRRGDRGAAAGRAPTKAPRHAGRHADGRAARQAAQDAPRREARARARFQPLDLTGVDAAGGRDRGAVASRPSPPSAS